MPHHNLQEPLQTLTSVFDDIIREPIREDFSRQWRDRHPRTLPLEDVPEMLKVRVAAADGGGFEFEGRDVGAGHDLVIGIHVPAEAMGLRVSDLG